MYKRQILNIPVFDRDPNIDIKNNVADFTNILLLDIDMRYSTTLTEDAKRIQKQFHRRMKYIDYSGIKVIRDLQKQRGKQFLSPIVFSSNLGEDLLNDTFIKTFGDISYMISQTPQACLDFQLFNKSEGLYIVWDSIDELFPQGLLDDMFLYFEQEINYCLNNEFIKSDNHYTLGMERRQNKIKEFIINQRSDSTLIELFMDTVKNHPQNYALINGVTDEKTTYKMLKERVLQIAAALQKQGLQPGKSVAVDLPKGVDFVASILAIMLNGSSYVPIGQHQPIQRIERILSHEHITHVICYSTKYNRKDFDEKTIINIKNINSSYKNFSVMPPKSSDTAYIIFTSGSTGEPKGVEITHEQVLNTLYSVQDKCNLSCKDIVMNVSQFDFDLSVFDIFSPLIQGATMCYVNEDYWRDGNKWLEIIQKYPITIWNSVPTLFQMLLENMEYYKVIDIDMKYVLLSGDWIDVGLPKRMKKVFQNSKMIAMGGATEASIWSNYVEIVDRVPDSWMTIPYGKPLPNQLYRIVNNKGKDVNDYEVGELWIGGISVAKGYYDMPNLTNQRFVMKDGLRWYKTGDKGRFWRDDTIEFLGRMDYQISLRGHRIEPEEIDSTLRSIRGIDQSITVSSKINEKHQLSSFITLEMGELLQNSIVDRVASFKPYQIQNFINNIPFDVNSYKAVTQVMDMLLKKYLKSLLNDIEKSKVLPQYNALVNKWIDIYRTISFDDKKILKTNKGLLNKINDVILPFKENALSIVYGDKEATDLLIDEKLPQMYTLLNLLETGKWINETVVAVFNQLVSRENNKKSILVYGNQGLQTMMQMINDTQNNWTYVDSSLFYLNKLENQIKEKIVCQVDTLDLKKVARDKKFDVIILNNELHRVENLDYILKCLKNSLKPGGIIIVSELTKTLNIQYLTTILLNDFRINKSLDLLLDNKEWIEKFENSPLYLRGVVTDQNGIGGGYIYILQNEEAYSLNDENLKHELESKLPYYMIPTNIFQLDNLPITFNGKINRSNLMSHIDNETSKDALIQEERQKNMFEIRLSKIWEKLLNKSPILKDDFFQLGGDSLLATQLRNEIQSEFNITLNLEEIFNYHNLKQMAEIIERKSLNRHKTEIINIIDQNLYEPFPLTEVQQAYILGRNNAFEYSDVTSHCYFELETDRLDKKRLELAWNKLIKKHLSLRTVIRKDNLSQIVLEHVEPYHIEYFDFTHKLNIEDEIFKVREQLEHQNFNPYQWPSFDIKYLDLPKKQGRICISFDNLFFDGYSMFQLFREWQHFYTNPNDTVQFNESTFRSYVLSQEEYKKTDIYKKDLAYWKEKLPCIHEKPDLNINHKIKTHRFNRNYKLLNKLSWSKIKDNAKYYGVTPASILMSVYAETLARWSKSQKFTINLTRFERLPFCKDVDNLIGDFTTLTLLPVDVTQGKSFIERTINVQTELREVISHTSVSGVTVQRLMSKKNNSQVSMPVVFTSGLGVNNNKNHESIGRIKYGLSQTPQVWMDLQVFEDEQGLNISLDSIKGLFEPGMIDDMFESYYQTLEQLSENREIWESEQSNIIKLTPSSHGIKKCKKHRLEFLGHTLLEGFDYQVKRKPNQIAVIDQHRKLTYKEIDLYANGVAQKLKDSGIVKRDVVAIISDQTYAQIVAIIATLKIGAIFVPLSKEHPLTRNQKITKQAKIKCIIANEDFQDDTYADVPVIRFNHNKLEHITTNTIKPDDIAYIIYTSGTTGTPKGVAIQHSSVMNTILAVNEKIKAKSKDKTIMISQMTFDLAIYDIFSMFQVGGSVVVLSEKDRLNPEKITQIVETHKVTIWNSVPALFKLFLDYIEKLDQRTLSIKKVLLSGDWIHKNLYKVAKEVLNPQLIFYGLGGATEASIWSNSFDLALLKESDSSVPYGHPLANQRMYILNSQLNECPIGVIGDLYIAGEGLAECYWNDATKTKHSFFFHSKLNERLYKTGDTAMVRHDGQIIFMGREDNQVKLNGYRIELGEIEQSLKQITEIKDALVLLDNQLIAFYILKEPVEREYIENELRKKLPSYMIPKIYHKIIKFPLTINGKVDCKRLLKDVKATNNIEVKREFNDLDKKLKNMMVRLLKIKDIKLGDDFFKLGGDSLKALQLIQLIKEELSINLTLKELFNHPKLYELSNYIKDNIQAEVEEGEI